MYRLLAAIILLLNFSISHAAPLYLECSIHGKSFDHKFEEMIAIKINDGMIDIVSEEFPMFSPVDSSSTEFKATKNFTSEKGVKYFFSIRIDRVSGTFSAYETSAFPDRKIYNTIGSGPCTQSSESSFNTARPRQSRPPVRVIIEPTR